MSQRLLNISEDQKFPPTTVTSTMVIYGGKGMGKRLALDTPLATPSGWTTMGEVLVGDSVFSEDGDPCSVTYISPIVLGDSYKVTFSDNSSIVADAEHLWFTQTKNERKRGRAGAVRTTLQIRDTLLSMQGQQIARTHSIRNTEPLNLPKQPLPLHPYVLGVWLGDGASASGSFTTADPEVIAEIESLGFQTLRQPSTENGETASHTIKGIKPILRSLGVLSNKHIPAQYLRGSRSQRLALLQGLMDTDGGMNGGTAEFSNKRESISRGLMELLVSLGMKATLEPRPSKLNGVIVGTDYRVRFVPIIPVFRLKRKADLCNFTCSQQSRRVNRYIASVDPVAPVAMRCIAVDSPSHLYLAGHQMVPTHNTNYGRLLVEECSKAGLRWAVIDPMGVWWGVRHSIDGKGLGIECLILGGPRGDIPIEPTGGSIVADLVTDYDIPVIVDISRKSNGEMWSIGERIRFVTDYGRQLFKRQGSLVDGQRREPILQILDEAARFIPQTIRTGDVDAAKCESIWSTIVEEGRNVGIGVCLLTQRSARLNKNVAELADLMLAFRTIGPNSLQAVLDWLGAHIAKEKIRTMSETIRSLPVGSALAVSPGWMNIEKVIRVRLAETFDSSATPKPGESALRVKGQGAKPDLDVFAQRMKETIERAAADDPKALRKRIAELEAAARRPANNPVTTAPPKSISPERERMLLAQIKTLEKTAGAYEKAMTGIDRMADDLLGVAERLKGAIETARGSAQAAQAEVLPPTPAPRIQAPAPRPVVQRVDTPTDGSAPTAAMLRILNSIAWFKAIGIPAPSVVPMAFMANYTVNGHFNNLRGALRTAGLITYLDGQRTELTVEGERYAVVPDIPQTDEGLQDVVLSRIAANEAKILRPLIEAWPKTMDSEALASAAGYTVNGHFNNMRGHLKSLGLIEYVSGKSKAADLLFPNQR